MLKKLKEYGQKAIKMAAKWPITKKLGGNVTGILITLGIIAAAVALGVGSQYYLGEDNVIEEAMEEVIKDKVGVDLDLSPSSPEKK